MPHTSTTLLSSVGALTRASLAILVMATAACMGGVDDPTSVTEEADSDSTDSASGHGGDGGTRPTGAGDADVQGAGDATDSAGDAGGDNSGPTGGDAGGGGSPVADIFDDEFDTLSWYDDAKKTGNWSPTGLDNPTQEGMNGWGAEYDINPLTTTTGVNPYSIASGVLTITTDKAAQAVKTKIGGAAYTSAAMRTENVTLGYGYYEMRAQLPASDGNWPAFWLLPADGAWPPEIDIFEGLANDPEQLYCTVHSTVAFPGNTDQVSSNHWQKSVAVPMSNNQTSFHTYGLNYAADKLTWYVDGTSVLEVGTPSDLVNRAVYIIIDNALGGWNGNAVDASTTFPSHYQIDYVRVYTAKP